MAVVEQCLPISEISSYIQRWTIRARVTSKSVLRTFSKGTRDGKVFHVHLLDAHGGEIRASFFNEAAGKHFDQLQQGKCYTFTRGSVRIANQQFNACKHRYELVFDKLAQVEEVDDDKQIEEVKLSVVDIRAVESRALPCSVDLCGIVTNGGSLLSFTSKDGKDLVKRDITVADDTARSIIVTIWGDRAKQEDKAFEGNPVVGLKGVLVKEWNGGRSGSLSESGVLVFKPAVGEAERVQRWWSEGGSTQSLTPLSAAGGGGAGVRRAGAKLVDLADMRRTAERLLDQPELCSVVCRLALVQLQKRGEPQPLTYVACQELRDGKPLPCNRRVDSSGYCASCNRAGKSAARFNLRCRFADHCDNAWLTTFHEAAQEVAGITAEQAQKMEQGEGGREALEAAIMGKYFNRPLQLTLRAKAEVYNGESRTSVTCIDARPVPRGQHGRHMLKEIREHVAAISDLSQ
uniref:Replication protein A subunit n=1 Tax=Pyrodinium bahamense TaxID=73915 RepID=A0A7S0BBJ9_9DINO